MLVKNKRGAKRAIKISKYNIEVEIEIKCATVSNVYEWKFTKSDTSGRKFFLFILLDYSRVVLVAVPALTLDKQSIAYEMLNVFRLHVKSISTAVRAVLTLLATPDCL